MSRAVFDAPVVAAWMVASPVTQNALALKSAHAPLAPSYIMVELANVLWRYDRVSGLPGDSAAAILPLLRTELALTPDEALIDRAFALARRIGEPVFDCLYVALAMREGVPLVTLNRRLIAAVEEAALAPIIKLRLDGRGEVSPTQCDGPKPGSPGGPDLGSRP
ncbi:PilT protein, N-terminal [Parvularcula bermudensis HTCC2503]|uniref:Ribonuclease VapC n=1 Tax=Parvularcula bermudensis (strain ATCC BAA-594 / HTCC2503 / KCTC 12087) TaxID=314260 RepID=E0TE25_PARBH|nr:type II toxin-antitoxin system VapC family toxin [Parvularcula bermudensis]ADM08846.1 PilT protein, N-terminal [Parvularcula bermudensis HTCC2503]